MELRRSDTEGLSRLAAVWKTTPGAEYEAMLTDLDLTGWQDIITYLRSLGMRENPQIVKMNICLSNNIRFTLEGAGVIQAYCRDNRISDKPFVAMLKEPIADAEPVTLGSYSAKAKLKRELPLAADDVRVKEAIAQWSKLNKHFRNIQRFEFVAPGTTAMRFDVSIVRENADKPARTFQEARVTGQPPRYEVEVELTGARTSTTPEQAKATLLRGLSWLLQGRQRSYVLVSNTGADFIRESVGAIMGSSGSSNRNRKSKGGPATFNFPGPQPATLVRANIVAAAEPGIPNLRTMPGGYNVTDKADGLRCLLFVSVNGRIFLIDGGGRVYATGKQVDPKSSAGLILDGEWIRRSRTGARVSHYYAFDILATGGAGGSTEIAGRPFMVADAMIGSVAATGTRQAVMASAVGLLGVGRQAVGGVPPTEDLQVGMKTFRACGPGPEIFQTCAAVTLENAKAAPYNTDGLIFTPNAAPLPLGRGTWPEQLKWKPPHENTIDFLVLIERERTKTGEPTAVEAIGTKYREDTGQTVRYKTLRLFVGSSRDAAFADPRSTIVRGETLPLSLDKGEWRPVEFRPMEPRDPMASVCYVELGTNVMDTNTDLVHASRTGDVIQSDMIVEMAYHPERAPGWRWEAVRVRHDKTERWLGSQGQGQGQGQGKKSGSTMNADWVANSIWSSLHNPVTEDAICTGQVQQCAAPATIVAANSRRVAGRDAMKVQCMRNFHDAIKRKLLRPTILAPGSSIGDLAMSNGPDIGKWIAAGIRSAFGCDMQAAAINDPEDGAYRRLLNKMIELGPSVVPPMTFVQADAARRLTTGEAGMSTEDSSMLQSFFGSAFTGFDVTSCMFALHYMCRDENTLAGFLTNLADLVAVGGYFVGCCKDGDAVARLLAQDQNSVVGRDGKAETWLMTKRYGSGIGSSVPPSAAGLGLAVDIEFMAAGETSTEYLVSWPYMVARLSECGLEVLTVEEAGAVGLPSGSQMFGDTWAAAKAEGDDFAMTEAIQKLSFLNRWFVLRRQTDRRPVPPSVAALIGPPPIFTEQITEAGDVIDLPESGLGSGLGLGSGSKAEAEPEPEAEAESKPFLVNAANNEPDLRLGPDLASWPRYLSLGTQVEIADLDNPAVKYPSIEAAIASAKYQKATADPVLGAKLGPLLFGVSGATHQKFEGERQKLRSTGAPAEAIAKSVDDEVAMVRTASSAAKMKIYKAIWDQEKWLAVRADVYQAYLAQRYATDAQFKAMIDAIKTRGGEILYVNGVDPSYLGIGLRIDGSLSGGDNMIGKWMMAL